jgi:LPXTG-motif cell wall-anchored protein
MLFALWLLQAEAEGGPDNITAIRVVAGILMLVCLAIFFVRRKRKASKEDWP